MQQGGSQYGAPPPDMTSFASGTGNRAHVLGAPGSEHLQQQPLAEVASPISSRPPPRASNFDELASPALGGCPDEDALAAAGEEAERGVVPGNRWPRQETLALLKIRSEMDTTFRDATLKAPLWEDVSRKLAELGYKRSAKKCKEKFENVHKYYKRTKEGRAGRQDGKNYRFFTQLEALQSGSGSGSSVSPTAASAVPIPAPAAAACSTPPNPPSSSIAMMGSSGKLHPTPLNTIPPTGASAPRMVPADPVAATTAAVFGPSGGVSFSATSSSSASESEEDTEEGLTGEPRKRKRRGGGGSSRKMMAFFEGLMRQVMERQEVMQQKFLETIEKREQDRMIREEAWKRQEMARLNREHDMMSQERAISASRDAAIIAFLQKMTGQTVPVQLPVPAVAAAAAAPQPPPQQPVAPSAPPPVSPQQTQPPPAPQRRQNQQPQQQTAQHAHDQHGAEEAVRTQQAPALEIVPLSEASEAVVATDPASSRWPKSEVHALIQMRSEMESRYQEAGPKGPLWEEISAGMQRMGYSRSSKRCKEKWENINKYFKKVKESSKKRPDDSKTCPYFHQLDALYRKKFLGAGGGGGAGSSFSNQTKQEVEASHNASASPPPQPPPPPQGETEAANIGGSGGGGGGNNNGARNGCNPDGNGGSALQAQTSNGEIKPCFFLSEAAGGGGGSVKKPESSVMELMDRRRHLALVGDHHRMGELDRDDTDQDCDEDDEDGEDGEMEYRIQYQQRPGVNGPSNRGGTKLSATAAAAAGSFMAMMQ